MNVLSKLYPYLYKYRVQVLLAIVSNILLSVFTVISIPLIIPFFKILFEGGAADIPVVDQKGLSDAQVYIQNSFTTLIETRGKEGALILICLVLIGVFFLRNLFRYTALAFMTPVRNGVVKDLRANFHSKLLDLPISFYSKNRKGDLISRATADVAEVETSILTVIEALFKAPIIMVGCLLFMFYISVKLTLFVFVLILFTALVMGSLSKSLKKRGVDIQSSLGELTSTIEESINGVRVIKAYQAEPFQKEKFETSNYNFYQFLNKLMYRREMAIPMSEFLGVTTVIILMWYGARMVFAGELMPEIFFAFVFAFYQVIEPSKLFANANYTLQRGEAALDRVLEILNAPIVINEVADSVEKTDFNSEISIQNLSYSYEGALDPALDQINLTIKKGEIIALVGPSGGGKSTFADLLLRMYDPSGGNIEIDGVDIKKLSLRSLRALFGYVSQEAILFNDTIEKNITLGAESSPADLKSAATIANADSFIADQTHQFETVIGDKGMKLSGGQRQRLTIARAVLRNPPILLLDEATSALDSESERVVQESIENALQNRTAIIIAHRLSTIQKANKIIVLDKGKIVQTGSHSELILEEGIYKNLIKMQSFD
ncbi:MAG TPA: ABC transporter ATP-binding protein [Saprospiraceae bacterium]|nr:ABC transporter ATP-binding protein [Saprospiraceae bacterium]